MLLADHLIEGQGPVTAIKRLLGHEWASLDSAHGDSAVGRISPQGVPQL